MGRDPSGKKAVGTTIQIWFWLKLRYTHLPRSGHLVLGPIRVILVPEWIPVHTRVPRIGPKRRFQMDPGTIPGR